MTRKPILTRIGKYMYKYRTYMNNRIVYDEITLRFIHFSIGYLSVI